MSISKLFWIFFFSFFLFRFWLQVISWTICNALITCAHIYCWSIALISLYYYYHRCRRRLGRGRGLLCTDTSSDQANDIDQRPNVHFLNSACNEHSIVFVVKIWDANYAIHLKIVMNKLRWAAIALLLLLTAISTMVRHRFSKESVWKWSQDIYITLPSKKKC